MGITSVTLPLQVIATVKVPAFTATLLCPTILIHDGFEIDSNAATGTYGFCITHPQWTGAQVVTFDLTIVGYEY